MSVEHKPEFRKEKDRIYKADGWISDSRVKGNLKLTRGLGDLENMKNKLLLLILVFYVMILIVMLILLLLVVMVFRIFK